MKEIVIISGKGGTGKTSLTAAFSQLADSNMVCDADVDAADLHLLLTPEIVSRNDFIGGRVAAIREGDCNGCRTCEEICNFAAIENMQVDPQKCEGCGVCVDLCPEGCIDFPYQKSGEWYYSLTRAGGMVHARLGAGEENSGKLVSLVRKKAAGFCRELGFELLLTDGPPGIGCPVIAAIGGASVLVIIVEPTISGLHDLSRVADLARHFRLPAMVCVNKFDINLELTREIEQTCQRRNVMNLGRIPFDLNFTRAMVQARTILEFAPQSRTVKAVRQVWSEIISSPAMKMAELPSNI